MENTFENKKSSIDALAKIVADMQQIYTIAQNIKQYCDEYAVFAGNEVINDMRTVQDQLRDTNKILSNAAEKVERKVDQVLAGVLRFPEYKILTIDRRLVSGETKRAYILKPPSGVEQRAFFIPKSMAEPNSDAQSIDFKYYQDFSVVVMSKGKSGQQTIKVPVQYLVQFVESLNEKIMLKDLNEQLSREVIQFYSTGDRKELWPYDENQEEIHKDPVWGKAMDDLFLAGNDDVSDIESLVYMRRNIDPDVTAEEMKICCDFLYGCRFEDFESITTMTNEQDKFVGELLNLMKSGKRVFYEYIPKAEQLFGLSHPQDLSREAACIV